MDALPLAFGTYGADGGIRVGGSGPNATSTAMGLGPTQCSSGWEVVHGVGRFRGRMH